MSEHSVLAAAMQSRKAYESVARFSDDGDFSDKGELVFKEITRYYGRDAEADACDVDIIKRRLAKKYPTHAKQFTQFLRSIKPVSTDNVLDDYCEVKCDMCAEKAGAYLMAGEHDKAAPLLAKYNELKSIGLVEGEDAPAIYQDAHADDFMDALSQENRIPILPKSLNEHIGGGLIAGCHTLIYAPPETGKTAVAINLMYGICKAGKKCLYIGNEESAEMYLNRMLSRFTLWPESKVQADRDGATELARKKGWGNLIFVHLSPGTVPQVQRLILEHMPDVVVIDQLVNLRMGNGKEPEKTQLLEKLAYVMRMFYSKHKIAGVSMSQADENAIGKRILTIKNVYYSNIAVQGQADLMIGIGMDSNMQHTGERMLCITKNKLGGEHLNLRCQLVPKISQLRGLEYD